MCYAIIGWIYEVFLEVVVYRWVFTNRGELFGPYCPVYGFGALAFIFTAYKLIKGKPLKEKILYIPLVFLSCMAIATLIELVASYLCEWTTGTWQWKTYERYAINFQARIQVTTQQYVTTAHFIASLAIPAFVRSPYGPPTESLRPFFSGRP